MSKPYQKQQKLEPLVRVRQIQLDLESQRLNSIKHQKEKAQLELQHFQRAYIDGIDRINRERQSPERAMLDALERSVDYAKSQWYLKLKKLREIESAEKIQMGLVAEANRRLRMLEKLDERYETQQLKLNKAAEQKQLDEYAIQATRRKSAE